MELIPLLVAPLVLKYGIHLGQAGRMGVRGERRGMEWGHRKLKYLEISPPSQIGQQHATLMLYIN
jgi:hypothetical protein